MCAMTDVRSTQQADESSSFAATSTGWIPSIAPGVTHMLATPLAAILAVLMTTRFPLTGEVVDGRGKPVSGVEVALAFGLTGAGSVPILATTTTDEAGRFHLARLSNQQLAGIDATGTLWALKSGLGLGMVDLLRNDRREQVHRIVLEPEAPRRITLVDAGGNPIAGARVAPRLVQTEKTSYLGIRIPDDWLERLSAVTDGGGEATLRGLSRLVDLRSVRVTIPGRGTHVLMIPYSRGKEDVTLSVPRTPDWRRRSSMPRVYRSRVRGSISGPAAACLWRKGVRSTARAGRAGQGPRPLRRRTQARPDATEAEADRHGRLAHSPGMARSRCPGRAASWRRTGTLARADPREHRHPPGPRASGRSRAAPGRDPRAALA